MTRNRPGNKDYVAIRICLIRVQHYKLPILELNRSPYDLLISADAIHCILPSISKE